MLGISQSIVYINKYDGGNLSHLKMVKQQREILYKESTTYLENKIPFYRTNSLANLRLHKIQIFKDQTPSKSQHRMKHPNLEPTDVKRKYSNYSEHRSKLREANIKLTFSSPKHKVLHAKKNELIYYLIESRISAVNLIIKYFRIYKKNFEIRRQIIIDHILKEREHKLIMLQKNIKTFLVRKHIEDFTKRFDYVFFYEYEARNTRENKINESKITKSSIFNIPEIKIKFEKDGRECRMFYSRALKLFYLPIKKCGVLRKRFKVNFLVDGKVIVDPMYEVDNDNCGHFYNIIKSSHLRKKKNPDVRLENTNKYWENIFRIKMSNKENSSVSDVSEHNETSIEKLFNSNVYCQSKVNNSNPPLKSILKVTSRFSNGPSKQEKKVGFKEVINFTY
jgi:hypothetical protein